eukprot:TRINITY_DN1759_c0_g1_i1.p1 TRINITY_DN1759_c0_g1~~TRINITY_DN1759_c0_g1_i1.p1  ORF type:complete len:339 (+),score=63.89 TRINITY_DN1759_c0_g1_i1:40-1017(+)
MSLFETIPIDAIVVSQLVRQHWSIELGSLIKASQNHTFNGTLTSSHSSRPVIIRVTPDPNGEHHHRIEVEISLLNYLHTNHAQLSVSPPIATTTGVYTITHNNLIIVVFEFAKGSPVVWTEYRWLRDPTIIHAWGEWLCRYHIASRQYVATHPHLTTHIRSWRELHKGVMGDHPIDPADAASVNDPLKYGLLHGDLNCSNFFFDDNSKILYPFDWDQIQWGWYLYDLSQVIFGAVMLAGAGTMDGTKVEVDVEGFTEGLVKAYEGVEGMGKVDREALKRMIHLRKCFYYKFCSRAVRELEGDEVRIGMKMFCKFVTDWIDREGGM